MPKDGITINELSKMANVTVRTIRFYTDEGVLDEPAGRDRYARYTRRHYLQLCAAKQLKERFLPLRVIRDQMAPMNDVELERLAGPISHEIEQRFADTVVDYNMAEHVFAAQELQPRTQERLRPQQVKRSAPLYSNLRLEESILNSFLSDNENIATDASLRKQTPVTLGEVWHRIIISPSMELHVRDDGVTELGEIKRILASLRKNK